MWHVRAEAQRQVRTADVPAERAGVLVDLLVDEVLDRRSIALVLPRDGIDEPQALRRVDGSSVYTVAGADLHTSQRILDAEQRLVATAGRGGGSVVDESAVDLALLEMAANRTALYAGQASLVRQICTSGARLQLAMAPAGAGKTTAMRALVLAWTQDGGQVLGLARPRPQPPSSVSRPASAPTHSPNSPGHYSTVNCPTGRPRSARRRW
jgi:AAA domain